SLRAGTGSTSRRRGRFVWSTGSPWARIGCGAASAAAPHGSARGKPSPRPRTGGVADRLRQRTPDTGPEVNLRLAVWDEVGHLPERQRAVLYLRYRSDFSFDQIAAILGIDAGTARYHASTGVAAIRDSLAKADGEDR